MAFLLGMFFMQGAFAQNSTWIMPPYYYNAGSATTTALPIGTTIADPSLGYYGQKPNYTSNLIKDCSGNILFFIIDSYIYNKDGLFIDQLMSFQNFSGNNATAIDGTSEIVVVPDPANANRYYIISATSFNEASFLRLPFVSLLDMSLPSGMNANSTAPKGSLVTFNGDTSFGIEKLAPSFIIPNTFGKQSGNFFAASKLRSDNSRFLFVSNGASIFRFKIGVTQTSSYAGITFDNSTGTGIINMGGAFNPFGLRSEMELCQTETGYNIAIPFQPELIALDGVAVRESVVTMKLNNNGELIVGSKLALPLFLTNADTEQYQANLRGLEFSKDGNILYIIHSPSSIQPNVIEYYNFSNPNPAGSFYGMLPLTVPNSLNFQNSQIELAANDVLYFANENGLSKLTDASNPSVSNFSVNVVPFTYAPTNQSLINFPVTDASYWTWRNYMLPDQIDGMDYTTVYSGQTLKTATISGASSICQESSFTFTGSVSTAGSINNYQWIITKSNGVAVYTGAIVNSTSSIIGSLTIPANNYTCGSYIAKLVIKNAFCQAQTVTKSFTIVCKPTLSMSNNAAVCAGLPATFNVVSSNWPVKVYVGSTLVGTFSSSPFNLYPTTTTTYTVKATNPFGCATSISTTVSIDQSCLSACSVFTSLITSTANEPSIYGPSSVKTICPKPNVMVDGTCSTNENGYYIHIREINLMTWAQSGPEYSAWVSGTGTMGSVNLTALFAQAGGTFVSGKVYLYALSVGPVWTSETGKLFRVTTCPEKAMEIGTESDVIETNTNAISISPNPTNGKFNIDFSEVSAEKVVVYNMLGNVVSETIVTDNARNCEVDLTELPTSIYMVHVHTSGGEVILKKVVKN